jgi:small subunit ribosomal protein S8e
MKDQGRSTRKRTGGRRKPFRNKKRYQLGREPTETTLGAPRLRYIDSRGTERKVRALSTDTAQVSDGETTRPVEIEGVVDNPANINYIRRNIITKGAIVAVDFDGDGDAERARVTSRPGQDGQVNAVLVDE